MALMSHLRRQVQLAVQQSSRSSPIMSGTVFRPSSTAASSAASSASPGSTAKNDDTDVTFASLLRNCPFTQMGNPVGKVVVGKVYHVVNDDLYIDFGGKFPCVCRRPSGKRSLFTRGTEVKVMIKSLELSQQFLGFDKEMTLCEADCVFLGRLN
ncbi:hypothetical protein TCAL_10898 [Tigriopus californicus]|uniref:Uncharacterized protein n=1 Tax=Tigriopus californicus TaxID=6832 RepID=A0A553NC86_TIGCA|nr:small ribosomal subunit protein bS1m-like [Tigriopus californicus]TRY63061.1 hypothetical protein TCAL_10898 [Tigriopus californicus]|eukprot:TCALIF_10898-PA protein Name:"Similar to Mrps28 28S ribosomal protein S28, mitochondrial (Mus musculus)" AED:0.00 eAED:0.00 QI:89/1/1/1/1/1/2/2875/153